MILARFCTTVGRARQFLSGQVFMKNLRYFQQLPEGDDGIGDRHEGAFFSVPAGANVRFRRGAGPISAPFVCDEPIVVRCNDTLDASVLCMSRLDTQDGKIIVHPRWSGPRYAAVIDADAVIGGLVRTCRHAGYDSYAGRFVRYWDHQTEDLDDEDGAGFSKRVAYSWQREYRFLIDTFGRGLSPKGDLLLTLDTPLTGVVVDCSTWKQVEP